MEALLLPEQHKLAQLELLAAQVHEGIYPGYPPLRERLVASLSSLGRTAAGALILPETGPWIATPYNAAEAAPTPDQTRVFVARGLAVDSRGRPLHPWLQDMVENPAIGVCGGKRYYQAWGPNKTADMVTEHGDSLLMVERRDTGQWALPGGFLNGSEPSFHGAYRELHEETGLAPEHFTSALVYSGPVIDPRMTAHAWPETTAYALQLDAAAPRPYVRGQDDARRAAWIEKSAVHELPLFGAHKFLAELALAQLGAMQPIAA